MPAPKLTRFLSRVRRTILRIPRGQTMSYGGVALASGLPNGARAVVRALRSLDDIPWWRVRRANGSFAPQVMPMQEVLLRQEGWKPLPKTKPRAKKAEQPAPGEKARISKKRARSMGTVKKRPAEKRRPAKSPAKKSAPKRKNE